MYCFEARISLLARSVMITASSYLTKIESNEDDIEGIVLLNTVRYLVQEI
jgi:hypothetical protein